jgi:hypothetical protein
MPPPTQLEVFLFWIAGTTIMILSGGALFAGVVAYERTNQRRYPIGLKSERSKKSRIGY